MKNWKDYDLYIYDFDGTISDTGAGIIHALTQTLGEFGHETTPEQLRPFIGPPVGESLQKHFGITDPKKVADITKRYRHVYYQDGHVDGAEMYPGIKEQLMALHAKGKKLAIASLKPEAGLIYLTEKYGIRDYFSAICGPNQDELPATKEGIIELVFQILPKENSVMIGDSAFDVYGAHVHGIPCIGVHYGFGTRESLSEADVHVNTVEELSKLLL